MIQPGNNTQEDEGLSSHILIPMAFVGGDEQEIVLLGYDFFSLVVENTRLPFQHVYLVLLWVRVESNLAPGLDFELTHHKMWRLVFLD